MNLIRELCYSPELINKIMEHYIPILEGHKPLETQLENVLRNYVRYYVGVESQPYIRKLEDIVRVYENLEEEIIEATREALILKNLDQIL